MPHSADPKPKKGPLRAPSDRDAPSGAALKRGATPQASIRDLSTGPRRRPDDRGRPSGTPFETHRRMDPAFRELARTTAPRSTGRASKEQLRDPVGHKNDMFKQILELDRLSKDLRKIFGETYRRALAGHDEILSTSSVRELMVGVLEAHKASPLSGAQLTEINALFNDVSRVRLPTWMVGYAVSSKLVMQHPSPAGAGAFAEGSQTATAHSRDDRMRRNVALQAAKEEAAKPGATLVEVVRAALRAAIAYTLNDMMAPATARDVEPHILQRTTKAQRDEQARAREAVLKGALVRLGGQVEDSAEGGTFEEARGRGWRERQGKNLRSGSPVRFPPQLDAMDAMDAMGAMDAMDAMDVDV